MKKRFFSLLTMSAFLTLGLVTVNRQALNVVDAADGVWKLVTDASTLAVEDKVVIAASDSDVALSTEQKTNNRGQATITRNNDIIDIGSDVQILTLKEGTVDGSFALYTGSGYLYAASSGSNYLKTQTTNNANGSWTIDVSEGVATVKALGTNTRNWLRYNKNDKLFSCYASGQNDISIYKFVEDKDLFVSNMFSNYYHNGSYTKETTLYVDSEKDAIKQELNSYFHASAITRFRKTEYKPGELTMVTKSEEDADWGITTSTYKTNGNSVDHYTNGVLDYTVSGNVNGEDRSSLENWFVTLNDFKDSTIKGWTGSNESYSFDLTKSDEMKKMAREFVAPMWLVTDKAANYITFNKLTVEQENETLVMKLWASSGDESKLVTGVEKDAEGNVLFSKAVVNRDHKGGTATCIANAVCDICKEGYGTLAEHDFAQNSSYIDENSHARKCTTLGCTATIDVSTHDYSTGTCVCGASNEKPARDVTMNIYANKGTTGTKTISWTSDSVVFKNNQGSSSTAIRTSDSDHYRLYAKSEVVISTTDGSKIQKIVFTCTSGDYANALKNSIGQNANVSVSGSTVTAICSNLSSLTFTLTAQSRIKSIVVTVK